MDCKFCGTDMTYWADVRYIHSQGMNLMTGEPTGPKIEKMEMERWYCSKCKCVYLPSEFNSIPSKWVPWHWLHWVNKLGLIYGTMCCAAQRKKYKGKVLEFEKGA